MSVRLAACLGTAFGFAGMRDVGGGDDASGRYGDCMSP